MEIKGKILSVLPVVTGQGKNGEWRKQEFIVEIPDITYPKKLCLALWGDKVTMPAVGQTATIQFDAESREYNSRWYTECKAWKIEVESGTQAAQPVQQQQPFAQPTASTQSGAQFTAALVEDDLPF